MQTEQAIKSCLDGTLSPFDLVWHLYGPGRLIYDYDIHDMQDGALHRLQERLAPHFAALGINPTGVFPFDLVDAMYGEHGLYYIPRSTLGLRVLALSEALRRGLEQAGHVVPPQHPALPELAKYLADELERQKRGFVSLDRAVVTPHAHPLTDISPVASRDDQTQRATESTGGLNALD